MMTRHAGNSIETQILEKLLMRFLYTAYSSVMTSLGTLYPIGCAVP